MYARHLQVSAAEWRAKMRDEGRRVQTIWIFGPAGTGKSSLAKQYAQSKGEPFFVSGSTRDVFQGYAGQHTIILDELRPSSIPYADLLRVTDPYAIEHEVMAPPATPTRLSRQTLSSSPLRTIRWSSTASR